ncbi:MAG: hypothetical protein ACSHX6_06000 [Akkermansiaceae bacterium]
MKTTKKILKYTLFTTAALAVISSCTTSAIHNGRLPFSLMEKPPSHRSAKKKLTSEVQKMKKVCTYHAEDNQHQLTQYKSQIQPGDVIAFYMSHKEAWQHLKKANIQKVPYDLFRYGHLALVTPDSNNKPKLLQLAMKQLANIDSDLSYLDDKNWVIYRPPSLDLPKLKEFTHNVTNPADTVYDYSGAFGLFNAKHKPLKKEELTKEYTCCTLIVAALNYAGYELHSTHRNGIMDIVTPRQVVESWGSKR